MPNVTHPRFSPCTPPAWDEPARFAPQFATYRVGGHGWDTIDAALTRFETMPTV